MRSKFFHTLAIAGLTVFLATSCKSKPKNLEENAGANAGGETTQTTPNVADRPITTDPGGSDSGRIEGLATVYFEYDKASLSNDTRNTLKSNADWIKRNPNFTVQIEGHTDERGSVEYNLSLGERRAKSVKEFLVAQGIDAKRLTIISYGEEKPLQQGSDESAWGRNRRANFVPLQ